MADNFVWTSPDGVEITLPPLSSMKAGTIRRHRAKPNVDFMFCVLEELIPEDELSKVDELTFADAETLFSDWQSDDGVSVPQS